MRFLVAVLAAAFAQLVVYQRVADWAGPTAALALAYLMLSAAGAGYFSGTRHALAGFLAVIAGSIVYALVSYATSAGADGVSLILWIGRLVFAVVPYALGGAVAGWLGGRLRARLVGAGGAAGASGRGVPRR